MPSEKVDQFLIDFTGWASSQLDIVGLALVGSHARNAATETSDIDLVIIAAHPERYLRDWNWISNFGQVERQQTEDYGKLTSIRVWYEDGIEAEYGITDESWAGLPLDIGTREVISGGIRVLFERRNILSRHLTNK